MFSLLVKHYCSILETFDAEEREFFPRARTSTTRKKLFKSTAPTQRSRTVRSKLVPTELKTSNNRTVLQLNELIARSHKSILCGGCKRNLFPINHGPDAGFLCCQSAVTHFDRRVCF